MPGAKRSTTGILGLNLFLSGTAFAATAPYRAIVGIDAVGLTNAQFAAVMSLSAIGGALTSVLLGALSDRIADRRILVWICALMGIPGFGMIYLFPTAISYVIAFCLLVPFGNALFSQSFSFARAYFDREAPARSEFMVSALRSLFTVAWVIIPPVAGWLAARTDAFAVYAMAAMAHILSTLLIGCLMLDPEARVGRSKPVAGAADGPALARAEISHQHKIGIAGITLMRVALALHVTALPLIVTHDLHGSLKDVGIVASVAALLEVPCMIGWGYAAMRWPKDVILMLNAGLYGLYMALFLTVGSVAQVLWLQGLNAIATAALLSLTISYMQETIKGRVGLSTSLMDVVTVVSTMSAAGVFALFAGEGSYIPIFGVAALISGIGGGVLGWSRRFRPI